MSWTGYPIYRFLLFLITGILFAYFDLITAADQTLFVMCLAVVFICVTTFFRPFYTLSKAIHGLCVMLFFIALGSYLLLHSDMTRQESHYKHCITPGVANVVTIELYQQLSPNLFNDRFYAHVHQVDTTLVTGNVLVLFKRSDSVSYKIGDKLLVYDDISTASNERNPGDFNYAAYLSLIDVHGQMYLDQSYIIEHQQSYSISNIQLLRMHINELIRDSGLNNRSAAMVQALVIGDRRFLEVELIDHFRNAGVIHILALSGLHVGIILLILKWLLGWMLRFKYGKWLQSTVIISLLWSYAFVTGLSPSILRAVTMFSFITIGMHIGRKGTTYHSLAISGFVLLMVSPKLLFQVGFQLSYTAVFFIVLLQPVFYRAWPLQNKLSKSIWSLASVTLAAQIGVAPISLFYFHQLPGLFLIGNMILLPLLPFIIGASLVLIFLLSIGVKPVFLSSMINAVLGWVITLVEYISSFDHFIIKNVYLEDIEVFIIYFVIITTAWFFNRRLRRSRRQRVIQQTAQWQLHVALLGVVLWFTWDMYKQSTPNQALEVVLHQAAGSVISVSNKGTAILLVDMHAMDSTRVQRSIKRLQSNSLQRDRERKVDSLENVLFLSQNTIQIIDESGVYSNQVPTDVLLLSHSPQVHLDRVLYDLQPKLVISDGSNYRSYVQRWEKTCKRENIRFLNTYETGAIDLIHLAAYVQN